MQNNNKNNPADFVPQLLKNLADLDVETLNNIEEFFTEALLLLIEHELFEDPEYRKQWANSLYYLDTLSKPLENVTRKQFNNQIEATIELLESRKEVTNA